MNDLDLDFDADLRSALRRDADLVGAPSPELLDRLLRRRRRHDLPSHRHAHGADLRDAHGADLRDAHGAERSDQVGGGRSHRAEGCRPERGGLDSGHALGR